MADAAPPRKKRRPVPSAGVAPIVPAGAVARLMHMDRDVKGVNEEAAHLVAKGVELFLEHLMDKAHEVSLHHSRTCIEYYDVAMVPGMNGRCDFLKELLQPPTLDMGLTIHLDPAAAADDGGASAALSTSGMLPPALGDGAPDAATAPAPTPTAAPLLAAASQPPPPPQRATVPAAQPQHQPLPQYGAQQLGAGKKQQQPHHHHHSFAHTHGHTPHEAMPVGYTHPLAPATLSVGLSARQGTLPGGVTASFGGSAPHPPTALATLAGHAATIPGGVVVNGGEHGTEVMALVPVMGAQSGAAIGRPPAPHPPDRSRQTH